MQDVLVLKVGTNAIARNGAIDESMVRLLVDGIINLQLAGSAVVLVSSGAVGAGSLAVRNRGSGPPPSLLGSRPNRVDAGLPKAVRPPRPALRPGARQPQ